jgi:ATPase subunit of ABC transporter with duplicated ATPase domains
MGGIFGGGQKKDDGGMAAMMAQQQADAERNRQQMQQQAEQEKNRLAAEEKAAKESKAQEDQKRADELAAQQKESNAQQNALRTQQGLGAGYDNTRNKQIQSLMKSQQGITGFGSIAGQDQNSQYGGLMGQSNTLVGNNAGRGFNASNTGGRNYGR